MILFQASRQSQLTALLAFVSSLLITSTATAQNSLSLLYSPWDGEATTDLDTSFSFVDGADVEGTGFDVDIFHSTIDLRVRFDTPTERGAPPAPAIEFDYDYIEFDSADAALPERLVQIDVFGAWTYELEDNRTLLVGLGGGYAGTNAFGDSDALYPVAELILDMPNDGTKQTGWWLGIRHDGNRAVFPDIPLPAIGMYDFTDPTFTWTVGFPVSLLTWKLDGVDGPWELNALFVVGDGSVELSYNINDELALFGGYSSEGGAYTDPDANNRRFFFQQRRLEAGVRYEVGQRLNLELAGGFAFDQELEYGFDTRDTTTIREFDDEPFVRFALDVQF